MKITGDGKIEPTKAEDIDRLLLPYSENKGQTHFSGCFKERHHHNCAVREVYKLNQKVQELFDALVIKGMEKTGQNLTLTADDIARRKEIWHEFEEKHNEQESTKEEKK